MYTEYATQKWQQLVSQFEASDAKTASEWCAKNKICYKAFVTWRKRLKNESMTSSTKQNPAFVELSDSPTALSGIQITLRNLHFTLSKDFDEEVLLRFLRILERV